MWRAIGARILFMWGSVHRNFGNRSNFRREHRHAIHRFTQAYNLAPRYRQARLARGIVLYRELGRLDEALADFNALLAEDPAYGPALLNRAMVAQEQGHYAAALKDLEDFLELPGQDAEYRQIAGRTAAVLREIVAELDERPPAA
jgi:tetratricopeptide (TPR) repeat protein